MARRSVPIPVPAAVEAGAAVDIDLFDRDAQVLLRGTFVATYQIQYSLINGVWHTLGADIVATMPTPRGLPNGALQVRVNTTGWTNGSAVCQVAGVER